jgi:hypothetical protein
MTPAIDASGIRLKTAGRSLRSVKSHVEKMSSSPLKPRVVVRRIRMRIRSRWEGGVKEWTH